MRAARFVSSPTQSHKTSIPFLRSSPLFFLCSAPPFRAGVQLSIHIMPALPPVPAHSWARGRKLFMNINDPPFGCACSFCVLSRAQEWIGQGSMLEVWPRGNATLSYRARSPSRHKRLPKAASRTTQGARGRYGASKTTSIGMPEGMVLARPCIGTGPFPTAKKAAIASIFGDGVCMHCA